MFEPHSGISSRMNLSQTDGMPAIDKASRCLSFFSDGRISIALIFWQSSILSTLSTECNFSARLMIPVDVSREHWDKFSELSKGAEDTIASSPSSDRRYAPFKDIMVNDGKLQGDRDKVARNM